MAASIISPIVPADEISLGDASDLFDRTGHPISVRTLQRQCKARGIALTRHGRADHASWTDLLEVHRDWVDSAN